MKTIKGKSIKKILKRILVIFLVVFGVMVVAVFSVGGGFGEREANAEFYNEKPLIFAHKGILNYYAENSLEGFTESKRAGFECIEADVVETSDNLVVFHDRVATRLLGIQKSMKDLKFSEIKNQNILFKGLPTENKVLTLSEFLSHFSGKMTIYLDLKDTNKQIADSVLYYMELYDAYSSTLIADQDIVFLSYLKYKEPRIRTVLEGFYKHKILMYYLIPKNFKPDFYGSFLHEVSDYHISFAKHVNILDKEIVYGVSSVNINDVYKMGLKNIIIDYDSSIVIPEVMEKLALHHKKESNIN